MYSSKYRFISLALTILLIASTTLNQQLVALSNTQKKIESSSNNAEATHDSSTKKSLTKTLARGLLYSILNYLITETLLLSHECGHAAVAKVLAPEKESHIYLNLKGFTDIDPKNELFSIGNIHIHNNPLPMHAAFSPAPPDHMRHILEKAYNTLPVDIQQKIEPRIEARGFVAKEYVPFPECQKINEAISKAAKDLYQPIKDDDSSVKKIAYYSAGPIAGIVSMLLVSALNSARLQHKKSGMIDILKGALTPFDNVLATKGLSKSEVIMEMAFGALPLVLAVDQMLYLFLPIEPGTDGSLCWKGILGKEPAYLGMKKYMLINLLAQSFFVYKGYKTYKKYIENATKKEVEKLSQQNENDQYA